MDDDVFWTSAVYVIAALDEQGNHIPPCKIGVATNPASRLTTIQTACPFKVELFMWIRAPTREFSMVVEQAAHKSFADRRAFGEWFDMPAIDASIGLISLMKEAFDCLDLPDHVIGNFLDKSGMTKTMKYLLEKREAAIVQTI